MPLHSSLGDKSETPSPKVIMIIIMHARKRADFFLLPFRIEGYKVYESITLLKISLLRE